MRHAPSHRDGHQFRSVGFVDVDVRRVLLLEVTRSGQIRDVVDRAENGASDIGASLVVGALGLY